MNDIQENIDKIEATIVSSTCNAVYKNSIIFCVDKKYLPYAIFVAMQIFEKEQNHDFDICICLERIENIPQDILESKIRFVEIKIQGIDWLPIGHLSLATYYRLFLPQIFRNDYEKIIYLDADLYIRKPFIRDLLDLVDSNASVAAVSDISEIILLDKEKDKQNVDYLKNYHYQNSVYKNGGVLFFDVKNYNNNNVLLRILEFVTQHTDDLLYHDQTALNRVLLNEIFLLPFSFNWQIHHQTFALINEYDPYILHFYSSYKPWVEDYRFLSGFIDEYNVFFRKYQDFSDFEIRNISYRNKRLKSPKYENKFSEFLSTELKIFRRNKRYFIEILKFFLFKKNKVRKKIERLNTVVK